jgi:uncharacterized protein (TIGR01244 family)
MSPRQITPDFFVSEQLCAADIDQATDSGFATIINNRPDGEAPDQPSSAELEALSKSRGIAYHHLPVTPGIFDADTVRAFAERLTSGARMLAFCRTGTRSVTLWALLQAGDLGADAVIETAAKAGYDLSALKPRLLDIERGTAR